MERVVADPAVLVSALITPQGNPALLWRAVVSGDRDLTDIDDPPVTVLTPARAVTTLL